MKNWLDQLDGLLRAHAPGAPSEQPLADATTPAQARHNRVRRVLLMGLVLAGTYGMFMGWYAVRTRGFDASFHVVATTLKLPLLFLLTTLVTFPSLYVFGTLLGSRMRPEESLRVVTEWVALMMAIAASLGPILGFFTLSTESYLFIVTLNVLLLGLSGTAGCAALVRRLTRHGPGPDCAVSPPTRRQEEADDDGPLMDARSRPTLPPVSPRVPLLSAWILLFGVVGLQMAWVMRPFVGMPGEPLTLFRPTQSNVFQALAHVVRGLLGGA